MIATRTTLRLVMAAVVVTSFAIVGTGAVVPSPSSTASPTSAAVSTELDTTNTSAPWTDGDTVVWVAADSQPENNGKALWERLNRSAEDVDNLPAADYAVMPGDIANPKDADANGNDPIKNIKRTKASYERISWLGYSRAEGALITTGNHEWGYGSEFQTYFGGACSGSDALAGMNTTTNVRFYGACGTPSKPVYYNDSFSALETELANLEGSTTPSGAKYNVITAFHQPVPGTISDCHTIYEDNNNNGFDIRFMADESRDQYDNLATTYGSSVLSATLMGHTHGHVGDRGQLHVTANNTEYVDQQVFGGGITKDTGSGCEPGLEGRGTSQFWVMEYGSDVAKVHFRHSCDDTNLDGNCDRSPYWDDRVETIPLDHPVQPKESAREVFANGNRAVEHKFRNGAVVHYENTSGAREITDSVQIAGNGTVAFTKYRPASSDSKKVVLTATGNGTFEVTIEKLDASTTYELKSGGQTWTRESSADGTLTLYLDQANAKTIVLSSTGSSSTTTEEPTAPADTGLFGSVSELLSSIFDDSEEGDDTGDGEEKPSFLDGLLARLFDDE